MYQKPFFGVNSYKLTQKKRPPKTF